MISEKIYSLRKKSGLSQEQLAEKLNVSRQAVSKWETGASVPDSERLIALSEYFNVSADYFLKDDNSGNGETDAGDEKDEKHEEPAADYKTDEKHDKNPAHEKSGVFGLIISIAGTAGLLIWGIAAIFIPPAADMINESSVIQINGSGILLSVCAAAVVTGAVMLFKRKK